MGEAGFVGLVPGASSDELAELRARLVGEDEEVDFVCVFVLDDTPGEIAGIEQVGVQPDHARARGGVDAAADMDRHRRGNNVPVEAARLQSRDDLGPLPSCPPVEDVVTAACRGTARSSEES